MKNTYINSFLGPIKVSWTEQGLEKIDISPELSPSLTLTQNTSCFPEWLNNFIQDLDLYFKTGRPFTEFPPVNQEKWTAFQKIIYRELFSTKLGETLSYGELASRCNRPKAARSVGAAMSRNQFPLLIPCHRVLPANGKLGNYTGGEGPLSKSKLISFEKSILNMRRI